MAIPTPDIEELARRFRLLGEVECRGYSPLYEQLALGTAADPELLQMLTQARAGQRRPTLFLAAANRLGGISPTTTFEEFRTFCLDNREQLLEIIETRATQTNEVGRSALLVPMLERVAAGRPLALVEIGCSAGLNLLFDRYAYDYGNGHVLGNGLPVLTCDAAPELLPTGFPNVVWRCGIDREPVDVRDDDAVAWLRACVWADQQDRINRFDQAVAVARPEPPRIIAGDVLDVLSDVVAEAPADAHLVLLHTWVVAYFPRDARRRFVDLIDSIGSRRDLSWLSAEAPTVVEPLQLPPTPTTFIGVITYAAGERRAEVLAECHPHGAWLRPAV
jgi:hypothetical protein